MFRGARGKRKLSSFCKEMDIYEELGLLYFQWSGCGGNRNNFQTEEACRRRCTNVEKGRPQNRWGTPGRKGKMVTPKRMFSVLKVRVLRKKRFLGILSTLGKRVHCKI
eukprot:TRINITY_DN38136_c0_g1_i1.p1 TRINITY_DN38136_c0_g1~~TRINITY_DN38136_c0_g1_i1.p1  ORF type:complete len:108 (-),score=13.58 TRINITY_DN38136_c0_g1_i1:186-509(-)